MKELKQTKPTEARIFALIPTEGDNAIIICRRSTKRTGVFGWDMLTNKVTASQWLKSRIHEYFSDITPDGKHFIYTSNDKGYGYTAISKAPWIKATSFWWDIGMNGGGFFIDNKRYILNNGKVGYHEFLDKSLIGIKSGEFAQKNQPLNAVYEALFTDYTFCARLLKNGWILKGKENKTHIFTKHIDENTLLEKIVYGYPHGRNIKGKGSFWEAHKIVRGKTIEEKEDWEWCEYKYDNIYYAQKGCLYELSSVNGESKLIYDFNEEEFVERIAPY
jgi:hypothetical protein